MASAARSVTSHCSFKSRTSEEQLRYIGSQSPFLDTAYTAESSRHIVFSCTIFQPKRNSKTEAIVNLLCAKTYRCRQCVQATMTLDFPEFIIAGKSSESIPSALNFLLPLNGAKAKNRCGLSFRSPQLKYQG
jgi:hypothetical protein